MRKTVEIITPVRTSINLWEAEGYKRNQSSDFFEAMIGFMASFEIDGGFLPLNPIEAFVNTGLASSKADFKRLLSGNSLTVNNIKINSSNCLLDDSFLAHNQFMMLGKGKSERALIFWNRT